MADIDSLRKALLVSPENIPLMLLLADACLDQFNLEEARTSFERVLAIEPGNAEATTGLAQILNLNDRTSEAIVRLEQLCVEKPDHAPAWTLRAKLALNENEPARARECYDRAIELKPELDGNVANNDGVLILGATNAPWHLDSAFLRPGRFDRLIFVPPPDRPARSEIVRIMAEGKPVAGLDPEGLAKRTRDFSGADIKAIFDQAVETALGEAMKSGKVVPVTQRQLARTARQVKPSTRKWLESARNYALYANQSGFYDEVLEYLGIRKSE